jgi:hypothetical protein
MLDKSDESLVHQLLNRFSNSFDLKAWDTLRNCLADSLHTDYSELRGTPPETMTGDRFVELRRVFLNSLKTHHLNGNHEITITGNQGSARVSTIIFRKDESGEVLNTHCLYFFGLSKTSGSWLITSITQKVFWNDGNTKIHQGIEKK